MAEKDDESDLERINIVSFEDEEGESESSEQTVLKSNKKDES